MRPSASMRWGACFPGNACLSLRRKSDTPAPFRGRVRCAPQSVLTSKAPENLTAYAPAKPRVRKYVPLPVLAVTAVKIRAALPGQRFTILGFSGVRKSWGQSV